MKKTFKNWISAFGGKSLRWFPVAVCLAAAFSLSACKDDDDDGGDVAQQPPVVTAVGIQYPVTQYTDGSLDYIQTYTYSNGRIIGAVAGGVTYSMTTNPLKLSSTDSNYGWTATMQNIKMDGSGFITYADIQDSYWYSYDGETESDTGAGSVSFEYDSEGHLVKESGSYTDDEEDTYSWQSTYTWQGGNLMSAHYSESDGYSQSYTYTYDTSKWPNTGVFPSFFLGASGIEGFDVLFFGGMMGRPTKNIPTTVTETTVSGSYTYRETYTTDDVKTNPDGSIRIIEMTRTYEGSSYSSSHNYYFGYANYPLQAQQSYAASPAKKSAKAKRGFLARRLANR